MHISYSYMLHNDHQAQLPSCRKDPFVSPPVCGCWVLVRHMFAIKCMRSFFWTKKKKLAAKGKRCVTHTLKHIIRTFLGDGARAPSPLLLLHHWFGIRSLCVSVCLGCCCSMTHSHTQLGRAPPEWMWGSGLRHQLRGVQTVLKHKSLLSESPE